MIRITSEGQHMKNRKLSDNFTPEVLEIARMKGLSIRRGAVSPWQVNLSNGQVYDARSKNDVVRFVTNCERTPLSVRPY